MAKFKAAPEVEAIAKDLIEQHHGHLIEAKVAYLFREGTWVSKGRDVLAKPCKVSDRDRFLSGYDFVIVVNSETWGYLTPEQRVALLDHELCHCVRQGEQRDGSPIWGLAGHDVEDFAQVVKRHGLWQNDLKLLVRAANEYLQGTFDGLKGVKSLTISVKEDSQGDLAERTTVRWILGNSCGDINYKTNVPRLTDEELAYCLKREKRVSGLKLLIAEAKRRGIDADAILERSA